MAHSILTYPGDGTTTQFALNFTLGYLSRDHIKVRVGGEVDGSGDPLYRTITYVNDSLIDVQGTVPAVGEDVVITRTVDPTQPYNDWADDAIIDELTLDENQKQALMLMHEILDGRISSIRTDLDMGNNAITMVKDPANPQDAVNKQTLDAQLGTNEANKNAAQVAQVAAETARDVTQGYRDEADADRVATDNARIAAEAARDTAETHRDTANTHKLGAQSAQTAAEAAQTASEAARDVTQGYRDEADADRIAAQAAATTATTKASEASASAAAAATSETNAANSQALAFAHLSDFEEWYIGKFASDPAGTEGQIYWNTTAKEMRVHDGTNFVAAYVSLNGALLSSNNLSDLANAATARANLGLGNVDNTSDANKPISNAVQTALDAKLASSAYTAADVLAKIKSVDGGGSGIDADSVDGYHLSSLIRQTPWIASPGHNADTMAAGEVGFTYANNAPHVGPIVRMGINGYDMEINGQYNGYGTGFSFRMRNGDAGSWQPWYNIWHSGNLDPIHRNSNGLLEAVYGTHNAGLGNLAGVTLDTSVTIRGRHFFHGTNNGAFTVSAPTDDSYGNSYTCVFLLNNIAGAGPVSFSGFHKVESDDLNTITDNWFMIFITKIGGLKFAQVKRIVG